MVRKVSQVDQRVRRQVSLLAQRRREIRLPLENQLGQRISHKVGNQQQNRRRQVIQHLWYNRQ